MPISRCLVRRTDVAGGMSQSVLPSLNILSAVPDAGAEEAVTLLAGAPGVRVERIVSRGHASPDGFWYDQAEAEWVMVASGAAQLEIEGEAGERRLGPGDSLFLPARCRHRVTWTDPDRATVWIAVFMPPDAVPAP